MTEKSVIKYSINHNFARIRIDSCNSLPIEKHSIFIWHWHVIVLIKSAVKKNKYNKCYNIFLEKGSGEDKSNTQYDISQKIKLIRQWNLFSSYDITGELFLLKNQTKNEVEKLFRDPFLKN